MISPKIYQKYKNWTPDQPKIFMDESVSQNKNCLHWNFFDRTNHIYCLDLAQNYLQDQKCKFEEQIHALKKNKFLFCKITKNRQNSQLCRTQPLGVKQEVGHARLAPLMSGHFSKRSSTCSWLLSCVFIQEAHGK